MNIAVWTVLRSSKKLSGIRRMRVYVVQVVKEIRSCGFCRLFLRALLGEARAFPCHLLVGLRRQDFREPLNWE